MPDGQTALLVVTVAVALGFDFTNGFHDTANAIATTISTRALGARLAIGLSAVLNLAGAVIAVQLLHARWPTPSAAWSRRWEVCRWR